MSDRRSAARVGILARITVVWLLLVLGWAVVLLVHDLALAGLSFEVRRLIQSLLAGGIGVAIVVAACRFLDRRSLESIGFGSLLRDWPSLLFGAGLWLALAGVAVAVGTLSASFTVEVAPPTLAFLGFLLLQVVLVFCYEALPEELAMRGYMQTNLAERTPAWLAVVGQAVIFMLWAFAFVWILALMGVASDWSIGIERAVLFLTFGMTLGTLRLWAGSLWASIGFHWAFQVVMQLLYTERLIVLHIPAGAQRETAGLYFWFFTIVLGGAIVLAAILWRGRKRRRAAPDQSR